MDFSLMKNFMDRLTGWRIPGNSISIRLDNKEIFTYQSGYSDLENRVSMSEDKLFNIYSATKVLTVTAAMQLYEKGCFLIDDPLYDFIPEYKNMFIKDEKGNITEAKNHITLRHLFTMTSGLDYDIESPAVKKAYELTEGKMNTLEVVKCIAAQPISFEPGEKWQYSLSHDVLAAVVEVVSGKKYREYVKENIFDPLQMNSACFHNEKVLDKVSNIYRYKNIETDDIVELQAKGCKEDGAIVPESKKNSLILGSEYDSGGAGITTSVDDYSKFAGALANGGVGYNGERIISSSAIDLLRTNQLTSIQRESFTGRQHKGYSYGLGVGTFIDKSAGMGNLNHFKWGGAAGATIFVDPYLKLSMFYTHHMLNPQEDYYQLRLINTLYACLE